MKGFAAATAVKSDAGPGRPLAFVQWLMVAANRTQIDELLQDEVVRALDVTWHWMLPMFILLCILMAAGARYAQIISRCPCLRMPLAPFQGTANRELWLSIMYMQVAGVVGSFVNLEMFSKSNNAYP